MKGHLFLPAFIGILTGYIGFHIYSASWIARSLSLQPGPARTLRIVFLLLALFSPLMMFMRRHFVGQALDWFYLAGYSWMGIILLAGSMFFLSDLLAPAARRLLTPAGVSNFRLAMASALGLIILYSFYAGVRSPGLKEVHIAVPGLPPEMRGLKIAQISDAHVDFAYKLGRMSDTIDLINAQKPDLVVVTGDLVDPGLTAGERRELGALMKKLSPRLGVFGVFGNHEYYYGLDNSAAVYGECGIRLLKNASAVTDGVRILGLNDIGTERLTRKELEDILARNRAKGLSLILTHQPLMCDIIARSGDFVILAGHVHRAQIFPFHLFVKMFYKYFYGLYREKGSFIYVTSGAGSWGPPIRFLAPSEVPLITLTRAD
jgi:hypothetical protein